MIGGAKMTALQEIKIVTINGLECMARKKDLTTPEINPDFKPKTYGKKIRTGFRVMYQGKEYKVLRWNYQGQKFDYIHTYDGILKVTELN